jgi:hypothetical protein
MVENYIKQVTFFRDSKPWEWIDESHLFGIKRKDSEEIDWIITMGSLGEHFAFGVYLGNEGLKSLLQINDAPNHDLGIADTRELQLSQTMLQVFFGNKKEAEKVDLKLYKENNLIFLKHPNQYFFGRNHQPFYMPQILDEPEMKMVADYIEIASDVYEKIDRVELSVRDSMGNILVIEQDNHDPMNYITSYARKPTLSDLKVFKELPPNTFLTARLLKELKHKKEDLHFTALPLTASIEDRGRPYLPILLLTVDRKTQLALNFEVMHPSDMESKMQIHLCDMFLKIGYLPSSITTNNERVKHLISPFLQVLDIELEYDSCDEILDEISHSFMQMMGG